MPLCGTPILLFILSNFYFIVYIGYQKEKGGINLVKEIKLIKYADTFLSEDQIFKGGEKEKIRPIIFGIYFIRTEDRLILVDAGCETMPGFDMRNFLSPVKALKDETGIDAKDITDVIITHSHHDHIEALFRFENARVHIQQEEYHEALCNIPENMKVNTFEDSFELEEGIRIIKIGGHSIGSCIVEVDLHDKVYVVCGDECYQRENLLNKIPTGCSVNPEKSEEFIEKYSSPLYETLLCHDL